MPRPSLALFKKAKQQSGIERSEVTVHTLRHSFACALLKGGTNVVAIQQLLWNGPARQVERLQATVTLCRLVRRATWQLWGGDTVGAASSARRCDAAVAE